MATLSKVADGVHVGPLFPLSMFNTVIIDGPDGDVVVDTRVPLVRASTRRVHSGSQRRRARRYARPRRSRGIQRRLCEHTGAPLAMSGIEADAFESGSIAWHEGAGGKYWIAPWAISGARSTAGFRKAT